MTYDEAMEGEAVRVSEALRELRNHGHDDCFVSDDGSRIVKPGEPDDHPDGYTVATIDGDMVDSADVMAWLGY